MDLNGLEDLLTSASWTAKLLNKVGGLSGVREFCQEGNGAASAGLARGTRCLLIRFCALKIGLNVRSNRKELGAFPRIVF